MAFGAQLLHLHTRIKIIPILFSFLFIGELASAKPDNQIDKKETITESVLNKIDSINIASRDLTFVNPIQSLEFANTARNLSTTHKYQKGLAYSYRNLSNVYIVNEIFAVGMQYLKTAENIFKETADSIGIADCYLSYGHLYRRLKNIEKEIDYFEKSYQIYSSRNYPDRLGVCALNLCESYFSDKDYAKSREFVALAKRLNAATNQLQVLSACYKVMGEIELLSGNTVKAKEYLDKVLELSERLGENSQKIATTQSLLLLAEIHQQRNEPEKQWELLNKALKFAQEQNLLIEINTIYNKLITYSFKNGEIENANKYITSYFSLSDSISTNQLSDKTNLVNKLMHAYDLEEHNRFLEQMHEIQKKNIKRQYFMLVVIASFALLLLVVIAGINRARKKK